MWQRIQNSITTVLLVLFGVFMIVGDWLARSLGYDPWKGKK